MSENLEDNPFLGLLRSPQEAQNLPQSAVGNEEASSSDKELCQLTSISGQRNETSAVSDEDRAAINSLIENIFCITISKKPTSTPLVFMEETASILEPEDKLDIESLEQALFERSLLTDPGNHLLLPTSSRCSAINHHIVETEVLTYLLECHKHLMDVKRTDQGKLVAVISDMVDLVIRNVATALTQPELYGEQNLQMQFLGMLNDYDSDHLTSLLNSVVTTIMGNEGDERGKQLLAFAFDPVLDGIKYVAKGSTFTSLNRHHLHLVKLFSADPNLGHVLLSHNIPKGEEGSAYSDTLFGVILSKSSLPAQDILSREQMPLQFDRSLESSYHVGLKFICDSMHTIFFNLFKTSLASRQALLTWIGKCLQANAARGQLANRQLNQRGMVANLRTVSDGFMINLEAVLLRLCKPFISRDAVSKILKVDPTYCAVEINGDQQANDRWVHLRRLNTETCLIPFEADPELPEQAERPSATTFNFVTEMFYMTHRALALGAQIVFQKWMEHNRSLALLAQQEAELRSARSPEFARVQEEGLTWSRVMQTTLLEPSSLSLLGDFYAATAEWLVQVAIHPSATENRETFAPLETLPLSFPLPNQVPVTLACVPEFIIENIACYLNMVRHFAPHELEEKGVQFLEPFLSQILVYMGSRQRMRNPHLRARLADCLELLLPHRNSERVSSLGPRPSINSQNLFESHPQKMQIVRCLLDVFVSIEETGESVSFEQKLNYRRPIYEIMDFLWTIREQREAFKALAEEAEADMAAVNPPLFLRFIYLLMNDAVFLLDEVLSNMAQLKTLQTARDNGEWDDLPPSERQQKISDLAQVGRMARIENILGKDTIHTLQYITTEISSIFCDPILVDRIAAMLNYFLLHLVGPKKKNFKVRDQQEFEFKPADLVMDICRIYTNLGKSNAFCLAVSQDGRSYNAQLFQQAEEVLVRIGGGMLIADLLQVAAKVAELAEQQNEEEEALAEAPEEFYDPILSTLMTDPVILPSSRTTCDRSTIAKHLLSSQTDPFTKAPLTMAQVIPDVHLKNRIEAWKSERHRQRASASSSQEDASSNMDVHCAP